MRGLVLILLASSAAAASDYVTNMAPTESRALSTLSLAESAREDIMVLYTQAALTQRGQAGMDAMVSRAVSRLNTHYADSQVGLVANLVYTGLSPVGEGTGMIATLDAYRQDARVRALRDQYGADVVVLLSTDGDWCGYAYLWNANGNVDAYAVVATGCVDYSFSHEVGHLGGLSHNREAEGNPTTSNYNFGYQYCAPDGFRDIMSYDCPVSVPRVYTYSSPAILHNGLPTGVDNWADAARYLNERAAAIAAYRTPKARPMPPADFKVN